MSDEETKTKNDSSEEKTEEASLNGAREEKVEEAKEEETSSNEVEDKTEEKEKKEEDSKEEKPKEEEKVKEESVEKTEEKEEKPKEEGKKEEPEEEVEIPDNFKDIVEKIEQMSVLELNELVKVFEKKFGVSASASAPAAGATAEGEEEEKDSFTIELIRFGEQKVAVIKVVKEILGLGLKEAKEFVEGAPQSIKDGIKKEEAEEIKGKIEEAGGQAELK